MRTEFFTGKGDKGESDVGGKKICKDSSYAELLGTLDELNAWLGMCRVDEENKFGARFMRATLRDIQEGLFSIQAEVAGAGVGRASDKKITREKVEKLEDIIKKLDSEIPKIKHFIVPGGSVASARLDVARTIARRAERLAVLFHRTTELSPELLQFLNRLSSVLFALARYVNYKRGIKEEAPTYK